MKYEKQVDTMKQDTLSTLNKLLNYSCNYKEYVNYQMVFEYCYYLIKKELFSCEEIDNLIADAVGSDVNIYRLYPSGNMINNRHFYNRETSGFDNMKAILDFMNRFGVDCFPRLGEKVIQNMLASDSNVCVEVDYDMVSEHTIAKYDVGNLLESIASTIDMNTDFYQNLFSALNKRGYQDEVKQVKKLIKKV